MGIKRDAVRLAELLRAGELTPVWVPGEDDEALRDLVRAREDLLRAKRRLSKFLLRRGIEDPRGIRARGSKYMRWLKDVQFNSTALQATFDEYRLAIVCLARENCTSMAIETGSTRA